MIELWVRDGTSGRDIRQVAELSDVGVGFGSARLIVPAQTITNQGAPWNTIRIEADPSDTIGGDVTDADYVPPAGRYQVTSVVNIFDNNSARVAHRMRYLVDGEEFSRFEGHDYMRDATAHDSAANVYPDLIALDGSQGLSLEIQTNSSQANTSDIQSGWITLLKVS